MASASKFIPFAVSAQTISQLDLACVVAMRRDIENLTQQLQETEMRIIEALKSGVKVEPGTFRADLMTTEHRAVAWQNVVIRQLGEAYANGVLAKTKADTFTHLAIEA